MADVKAINMHKRMAMGEKVTGMKKGGAVRHSDEAEDRKLIKKMIDQSEKKEAKGMKKGGKVAHGKNCTCKMCAGGRVK